MDTLTKVYSALEKGQQEGWSLPTVAKEAGVSYGSLYQMLHQGPFPDLFVTRKYAGGMDYRSIEPRALRCLELGFSLRSIERFLGRGVLLLEKRETSAIPQDYHHAALVYEAEDTGFTAKETAEVLDLEMWHVTQLLASRTAFEPKIVEGLKVLFDDPTISRPILGREEHRQNLRFGRARLLAGRVASRVDEASIPPGTVGPARNRALPGAVSKVRCRCLIDGRGDRALPDGESTVGKGY